MILISMKLMTEILIAVAIETMVVILAARQRRKRRNERVWNKIHGITKIRMVYDYGNDLTNHDRL